MHVSHVQSVQVYALPSCDAGCQWQPVVDSWDLVCVLCARDVVTEMAVVALHTIGVTCDNHYVGEKETRSIS